MKNFAAMVRLEKFPNVDYTPEKYLAAIEPAKEKHREFGVKRAVVFPIDYSFTSVKFKISYLNLKMAFMFREESRLLLPPSFS